MKKFINETLVIYISKFKYKSYKGFKGWNDVFFTVFNDRIIVPVDCQLTN